MESTGVLSRAPHSEREAQAEFIALHARALRRQPWTHLALAIGVALLVRPFVPWDRVLLWALPMLVIETGRAAYAYRLLRCIERVNPTIEHATFIWMAAVAGLSAGLAGWWFFPYLPLEHQALLGATMYAIPAAGVAVSQSSRWVLGAYAVGLFIPTYWRWALLYPQHAVPLAILTCVYAAILIWIAADSESLLRRALFIRHERDDLLRQMELRNAEVSQALRLAEQSARARAEVLAAASHDLRQPLHALSLYSSVLAVAPDAATRQQATQQIAQTVQALDALLGGLLDLSRLNSGQTPLHWAEVELRQVLEPLCAEIAQRARAKDLHFSSDLQTLWARTDALAATRIVRNLLDNAIKYTAAGAVHLGMSVHAQSGEVEIAVHDTGCGIALEDQERIFEEFYQVQNPGRDRSQGVGLGLAIVQRLVVLLGARITVRSAAGQGASFHLFLPLAAAPPGGSAGLAQAPIAPSPPLQGLRVLLVDDDAAVRDATAVLLRAWGVEVAVAEGSAQARALCAARMREPQHSAYDCLLCDWRLAEGENGLVLAQTLRAAGQVHDAVLISADAASLAELQAAPPSQGLRAALAKPLSAAALRTALADCPRSHATSLP